MRGLNKNILILISCGAIALIASSAFAGNKRIMSLRAAKVVAERAIVESIYGLKIRSTEEVTDMVASSFTGKTESKTKASIQGVKIESTEYDAKKDIAKATAAITLGTFTNIDGVEMNFDGRVFRRIGFATSTPSMAGPIKALRAAEIDAYKQLAKRIVGFTLESQTTVENFILTSDVIKTKVLATMYLADVKDYGWYDEGDAYVKMTLNVKEISALIGQEIVGEDEIIEVEGNGAQEDDFSKAKQS